jgi:hypothetical protein
MRMGIVKMGIVGVKTGLIKDKNGLCQSRKDHVSFISGRY